MIRPTADVLEALTSGATRNYSWRDVARAEQLPPDGDWFTWLIQAGRGWGKTRTGAETVRAWVESGACKRLLLVGETAADVRDVMVEGESGILACCPPWNRPRYEPSKRRLTWPNGAIATCFSAEDPEQLRGPQGDGAWCDEVGKWKKQETWSNLLFGLRLGDPRVIVTTTPKPTKLFKQIATAAGTVVTRGSTYANLPNLADVYKRIVSQFEGTRLGRQELNAELLEDVEGALWTLAMIEETRVRPDQVPDLARIVVSIDPAGTASKTSDMTGLCVAGRGVDGHYYVLRGEGVKMSPHGWASRALRLYDEHAADRIVAERNNGGDMVESTIRNVRADASVKTVVASRGKVTRAEPIEALYQQKKVHHVGELAQLEGLMIEYPVSAEYDDPIDALVWALTELMESAAVQTVAPAGGTKTSTWSLGTD